MTEDYTKQIKEINDRHRLRDKRIKIGSITGLLAGLTILLGGVLDYLISDLRYHNRDKHAVVAKYEDINSTLDILRNWENSSIPELPYESEEMKFYIEKSFSQDRLERDSLDRAIVIAEQELKKTEQTSEIKSYKDWIERKDKRLNYFTYGGAGLILSSFLTGIFLMIKSDKRNQLEYETLEYETIRKKMKTFDEELEDDK